MPLDARWRNLFATSGVEGLSRFELGGGVSFLSEAQEAQLKASGSHFGVDHGGWGWIG